jgi:chorismate-pyruvate lyase
MPDPLPALQRERYRDPIAPPEQALHAGRLLSLLLAQNGSTTRLCEVLAGGPVALHLLHQVIAEPVPELVHRELPGTRFIERISCLAAQGQVMTDNLVYIALDGLDAGLQRDLDQGRVPIGHLLAGSFTHRRFLAPTQGPQGLQELHARLWRQVDLPDPAASRAYALATAQGLHMLVIEAFRRGMQMDRRR